ncbi:MAG: hypothetical protein HYR66_16895, partial [Sphingobacteriales bacterium]|nr:hypothetical protein [Sphingobacteriales bacterium]
MATKKAKAASASHGGSGSVITPGYSISLADVSKEDFMLEPDNADRPDFKMSKYPVTVAVFDKMKQAAVKHEKSKALPLKGTHDVSDGESDIESKIVDKEGVPEDGIHMSKIPGSNAPVSLGNFDGISDTGWRPPDCVLAVGRNDVVVGVNADMAGYSKTGAQTFRWAGYLTLFRNVLPQGAMVFDPKMIYDHYAGRYVIIAGALRQNPKGSWLLVGVSQTANPAGAYWVWALDATLDGSTATTNWSDYPCLGFDTQALYITTNQFGFSSGFQYSKLRILNKAELYGGGNGANHSIRWYDFWKMKDTNGGLSFTVQPCKHFRGTGGNPDAYFVNTGFGANSFITLWTLANPLAYWKTGTAPSLTKANIGCRAYDLPPQADQPGSTTDIATNDNRMLSAVFQYAGGVQRIWCAHNSKGSWAGDTAARSVIQWYEIDVVSKKVIQQNSFGAKGYSYFFPAVCVDQRRNAFFVFSRSSANEYGSVRQTGRLSTDAPNT